VGDDKVAPVTHILQAQGVKNKHVAAYTGDGQIIMLYNVVDGPCTQRYCSSTYTR
jgi:DNA mismatch repair ATPase MutS